VDGVVCVRAGASLTINADTEVQFRKEPSCGKNSALVITVGAKIFVKGCVDKPVILTSDQCPSEREAGDWGGLLILGKDSVVNVNPEPVCLLPNTINAPGFDADNGKFVGGGGCDPDNQDCSGSIEFLRIEYAGFTAIGAGNLTSLYSIQVSYSPNDSFTMFGGSANLANCLSYGAKDDDYKLDYGYSGVVSRCVALRDSSVTGGKGHGVEVSSSGYVPEHDNDNSNFPTAPLLDSLTLVGTELQDFSSPYGSGFMVNQYGLPEVQNSIATGYTTGFTVNSADFDFYQKLKGLVINTQLAGNAENYASNNNDIQEFVLAFIFNNEPVNYRNEIALPPSSIATLNLRNPYAEIDADIRPFKRGDCKYPTVSRGADYGPYSFLGQPWINLCY